MYLKDLETDELYFVNIFEKWWHFLLLGFTWFIPHKAFLLKKDVVVIQEKSKKYSGIKTGILIGLSYSISDFLQSLDFYKVPEIYYWVWNIIAYPLIAITIAIFWNYILRITKGARSVDYDNSKIVKVKFVSLSTILHSSWKLVLSFIFVLLVFESIKFNLILLLITVFGSGICILTFSFFVGFNVTIYSSDNHKFKIYNPTIGLKEK